MTSFHPRPSDRVEHDQKVVRKMSIIHKETFTLKVCNGRCSLKALFVAGDAGCLPLPWLKSSFQSISKTCGLQYPRFSMLHQNIPFRAFHRSDQVQQSFPEVKTGQLFRHAASGYSAHNESPSPPCVCVCVCLRKRKKQPHSTGEEKHESNPQLKFSSSNVNLAFSSRGGGGGEAPRSTVQPLSVVSCNSYLPRLRRWSLKWYCSGRGQSVATKGKSRYVYLSLQPSSHSPLPYMNMKMIITNTLS